MNSELVIICPELARGRGGLADYTLRVAQEWNDRTPLRFILPAPADSQVPVTEYAVETIERKRAALQAKLPAHGGKVLLQYSAYGFDHYGYPRWLLQALADWKESAGGLLVIMFHEIWTFWPVLNRNYFIQQLHRRDLRALVAHADAIFTSTVSQAEHLGELDHAAPVQVLPVGSNITPGANGQESREPGLAVLFGLQGSRLRALHAMREDLASLASAQRVTRLVTTGGGNSAEGDREERQILNTLPLAKREQLGSLTEEEMSMLLSRASFGISAQDELSITKSGTFMAYAAHGLNILSPNGDPTRPEPLCWLTQPAELLRGLSADELKSRGETLRAWQDRTSSWSTIADRFAHALHLNTTVAVQSP